MDPAQRLYCERRPYHHAGPHQPLRRSNLVNGPRLRLVLRRAIHRNRLRLFAHVRSLLPPLVVERPFRKVKFRPE